jgi:hypothetical protein
VRLSPLGASATNWSIIPVYYTRMIDDDECAAVGGIKIGRGSRGTQSKSTSVPLCPPQIPHDLTCAATVGSRLVPILTTDPTDRNNAVATSATVLEKNYIMLFVVMQHALLST